MTQHHPIEHLDFNPTYTCEIKWAALGDQAHKRACAGKGEYLAAFEDLHHYREARRIACAECVRVMGEQDMLINAERI